MPTLLEKGSLASNNPKITAQQLADFIPIHYCIQVLKYKVEKESRNLHDYLLLVLGKTGSGKTTTLVTEIKRAFASADPNIPDESRTYRTNLDFNFAEYYSYPDDKYTIRNKEKGFLDITRKTSNVLCAQPTTILARTKANEIASAPYNPDLIIGNNIGFNTGTFKLFPISPTSIIMCTMGVLTTTLKNKASNDEEIMQKYSFILIDECHEQSIEMIEGIMYIIKFLRRNCGNPSCPVFIFMSATFDINMFAQYLGTEPTNSVIIEGDKVTRDYFYLDAPSTNIYNDIANKVYELHESNKGDPDNYCDILAFLPGDGEINKTQKFIESLDKNRELYIGKITSEINQRGGPEVDYLTKLTLDELREELKKPGIRRRVILATPVVETGLTIASLKYEVDSCLAKYIAYSPVHNLSQLLVQPFSKSAAEQRAGRVGRLNHGYVYRMLPEKLMDKLDKYKRSDLYTTDVAKVILDMIFIDVTFEQNEYLDSVDFPRFVDECLDPETCKSTNKCKNLYLSKFGKDKTQKMFGTINVELFPYKLLDRVPLDVYIQAKNKLISLGMFGTYIGFFASKIGRLSVESIRMIFAGYAYNVSLNDLLIIGLFLESKRDACRYTRMNKPKDARDVELFNFDKIIKSVMTKKQLEDVFGSVDDYQDLMYDDFLEPLWIIKWLVKHLRKLGPSVQLIKKARSVGLNAPKIMQVLENRNQLESQLKKLGFINTSTDLDFNSPDVINQIIRIKQCVHAGYKNNLAYLAVDGIHYRTNTGLEITPSEMRLKNKPTKILFGSLFTTMSSMDAYYRPNPNYIMSLSGLI